MTFEQRVKQLVRPEIQALRAYAVADASGMVKLDAMENPYTWPKSMIEQWQKELATCSLNRYPHPTAPDLVEQIRHTMKVPESTAVLLGNGSDEIIQLLTMTMATPGATVMAPVPGFVMYEMIAKYVGVDFHGVPLQENFDLDVEQMRAAIKQHKPALLYLATPNNPTGNLWDEQDLRSIIECMTESAAGIVVIDEAYLPFSSRDHLSWVEQYPHVVVMRTLSKVGLAGLRLGMLFGSPLLLNEIDKVRMPYNINVLTQVSATFALQHYDVLQEQCAILRQQRHIMMEQLPAEAFDVFPSQANFILVRSRQGKAQEIFAALKQAGILIKCLDGGHPLLSQCLRLTVSNPQETAILIAAIKDIVADFS